MDKAEILWIGFWRGDIILRYGTWTRLSVQEYWAYKQMGKDGPDWVNRLKQMSGRNLLQDGAFPFSDAAWLPSPTSQQPLPWRLEEEDQTVLTLWLSLVVGLSRGYVCKEGGIKIDSGGAKWEKTLWLDDSCPDMAKEKSDTPLNFPETEILLRNHHSFPAGGKKAVGKCFLLVYLQVYHLFCLFVYCFVLYRLFFWRSV